MSRVIVERTVEIRRPVSEVYAYLCDEARLLEWRHGLISVERASPPGPLDGSLYRETIATPLGPQSMVVRITTKPFRSIAFCVVEGAIPAQGSMVLRPLGVKVEMTFRMEYGPALRFPAPLQYLAGRLLGENVERSVANLKRILDPQS
jgi:uncharacterized membrane protein